MFVWIKDTLARVRIKHDTFFNENSLYENRAVWDVLEELEERGLTYKAVARENTSPEELEKAGGKGEAVWFRSTSLGDAEDRVLVKSTGEPTYTLPDVAYHINKINRGFDLLINVLGSDHYTEAQVVRYGLTALGYDTSKLHVILNQLVRTVRDGKEVRMSTRRGVYDTLDDLIDQTSADAVRYMLLARSADSQLNFDLDLAVKQSNENPVYYIQYAYVRCAGIFREAAVRGVSDDGADLSLLGEAELELPAQDCRTQRSYRGGSAQLRAAPDRLLRARTGERLPPDLRQRARAAQRSPAGRGESPSALLPRGADRLQALARSDGHVRAGSDVSQYDKFCQVGAGLKPALLTVLSNGEITWDLNRITGFARWRRNTT